MSQVPAAATELPQHRIVQDFNPAPEDITAEPSWPEGISKDTAFSVEIEGVKTINVLAGERLLCALERYGVVVPAVCRSGECSVCRVKLIEGEIFAPSFVH